MGILFNNVEAKKDIQLDDRLYLVDPISRELKEYSVMEVLEFLTILKGESTLEYISSIASTNGYCKILKANIFSEFPKFTELKSLTNLAAPDDEFIEDCEESLERDIYLVNQWTGIPELFTVRQILRYIGTHRGIPSLNKYLRKDRYCKALKSYIFLEEPTSSDRKRVLGYHILNDEVFRQIKNTPYKISQYGRVKKVNPQFEYRTTFILPSVRPKNRNENYVSIKLTIKGEKKILPLADIVGHSFVRNPDPKNNKYLCFKDGNTLNYIHSNLIWKSQPESKVKLSNPASNEVHEKKVKPVTSHCLDPDIIIYLVNPITLDVTKYKAGDLLDYIIKTTKKPYVMDYIKTIIKNKLMCDVTKCYMFTKEYTKEELKYLIDLIDDDFKLLIDTSDTMDQDIYLVNQYTGITESFTVSQVLESFDSDMTISDLNAYLKNHNRHCPNLNAYIFYEKPTAKQIKKVLGYHVLPDEEFKQYKDTCYFISQYGRVKSYRLGLDFRGDFLIPTIRPKNRDENYVVIRLYIDKRRLAISLSSLVGEMFVQNNNPKQNKHLRFKDENALNYVYSNLEWVEK